MHASVGISSSETYPHAGQVRLQIGIIELCIVPVGAPLGGADCDSSPRMQSRRAHILIRFAFPSRMTCKEGSQQIPPQSGMSAGSLVARFALQRTLLQHGQHDRHESGSCLAIKLALSRAGINRASLFPDLDGIAAHINWLHKWGIR